MDKLKVLESFAGYGSQSIALDNLNIDNEVVGISEIDPDAIIAYAALRGCDLNKNIDKPIEDVKQILMDKNVGYDFQKNKSKIPRMKKNKLIQLFNADKFSKNLGDISIINPQDVPKHDLFTYSFPCQDISVAGQMRGIEKGQTRSGLLYECEKIIEAKKPKYLLLENVKNLVGKKFKKDFDKWLEYLEGLGYTNYWQVLNAKNYGVPQNRERVFVVSILSDKQEYEFPEPIKLEKAIKDILEDNVDDKFYMNKPFTLVNKGNVKVEFTEENANKNKEISIVATIDSIKYEQTSRVLGIDGICSTINTMQGGNTEPKILCEGNINPSGKGINGNIYNVKGLSSTLTTNKGEGIKVIEYKGKQVELPCICASRGRKKYNNSLRITGDKDLEQVIEVNTKETSNTISTVQKDNYVIVGEERQDEGFRLFKDNVCGTIRTINSGGDKGVVIKCSESENNYKIRKLTPKECFRLMGLNDTQINKIQQTSLSNSAQYKLAGNSIVIQVLEGIFKKLYLSDNDEVTPSNKQ